MAVADLHVHPEVIAAFCRRNGIRKLSLFGSVLTERFSDTSDIDLLAEFEPECKVGYVRMAAMERELSDLFGRKVDLRTPEELSRYFREEVVKAALVQYARE
jgi:hypothetical protein